MTKTDLAANLPHRIANIAQGIRGAAVDAFNRGRSGRCRQLRTIAEQLEETINEATRAVEESAEPLREQASSARLRDVVRQMRSIAGDATIQLPALPHQILRFAELIERELPTAEAEQAPAAYAHPAEGYAVGDKPPPAAELNHLIAERDRAIEQAADLKRERDRARAVRDALIEAIKAKPPADVIFGQRDGKVVGVAEAPASISATVKAWPKHADLRPRVIAALSRALSGTTEEALEAVSLWLEMGQL